jgi:hypothetical protein
MIPHLTRHKTTFHCNGTFEGNWLRGDERGWRSRHHREHVEGDDRLRPAPTELSWKLELPVIGRGTMSSWRRFT